MHRPRFLDGDTSFLIALALLVALGLLFLSSASAPLAFDRFGNRSYYLEHQLLTGVVPGVLLFFIASRVRPAALQRFAVPSFAFGILLLLLVFVPGLGVVYNHARSWLAFGPLTFQPVELMKLGLILAFAAWATVRRPRWFSLISWTQGFLPFLGAFGVVAFLLALQPDVGSLVIVGAIAVTMAFAAGMPLRHLAMLAGLAALALASLIAKAPYRLARLTVFLHPELDPQGVGYQVNQALLAVGSGGIFGVGLGHSRQKFAFLPEVISDSIFAVIGEELGFIWTVAFLVLFGYVIWRVVRGALHTRDAFDRLVLIGIAAWWAVQALVNVGAMVGLLPLTGLPLPFVSSGGTSLAVTLGAAGIVLAMSQRVEEHDRGPVRR